MKALFRDVDPFRASVKPHRRPSLGLRKNRSVGVDSLRSGAAMAEYNIQLKAWHAVVAIVAVIGFTGFKMYLRVRTVEDGMRDAIRLELLNEYSGRGPKDIARLVAEARAGLPVEPVAALVQRQVEFTSIAVRGKIGGPVTLVRAEITVDGGPPPDGRSVRFFRVTRKFMEDGRMVVGETDSYRFFRELFP